MSVRFQPRIAPRGEPGVGASADAGTAPAQSGEPGLGPAPARLPRPRLLQALQARFDQAPAVWLAAGPGMGKSTLARQALAALAGGRGSLLALDETDADPASLLHRLAGLLGRPAPRLWREQLAQPAAGLRPAWRALWQALAPGQWLVLDDLHRAGDDASLLRWLPVALEEWPPSARLLLLSRRLPPEALAGLRLQQRLALLPGASLAFSPDEAAALAPRLPPALARWPAAVAAAAEGGEALLAALVRTALLPALDPADRQLLARLAWLPEGITPAAARALTGDPQAPARLAALAEAAVLVDAEAVADGWADPAGAAPRVAGGSAQHPVPAPPPTPATGWRLHALLRQALCEPPLADLPARQATLQWLQAQGQPAAALPLALEVAEAGGPDDVDAWALLQQLLATLAPGWLAACRHHALLAWCQRVPPAQRSPALWATLAAALAPIDPRAGRQAAEAALAAADALPAQTPGLRGLKLQALSQIIASTFQAFDATPPLAQWLQRLLQLQAWPAEGPALVAPPTPAGSPAPAAPAAPAEPAEPLAPEARAALAIGVFSALFLRAPAHAELGLWQQRVQAQLAQPVDANLRLRAAMLLAKQAWYTGDHAALLALPAQAAGAVAQPGVAPYGRLLWGLAQQYQAWATADLAAGRAATAAALAIARESGIHGLDRHLRLHAACFARLAGDAAAAAEALAAAEQGADSTRPMETWHLQTVRAWALLCDGQPAAAEAAGRTALAAAAQMGPAPAAMTWAVLGQLAWAQGQGTAQARAALQSIAQATGNPRAAMWADWLLAADWLPQPLADGAGGAQPGPGTGAAAYPAPGPAPRADSQPDARLAPLARALAAQRQAGGGLWFGIWPPLAARLAAWALEAGVEPAAATTLVRLHRLPPPPEAGPRWPWPVRIALQPDSPLCGLAIEVDGAPPVLGPKLPRRPLQLLAALVAGGGSADVRTLADSLWPEAEGDRADDALEVALRRLRQLLGRPEALLLAGGQLALNRQQVWLAPAPCNNRLQGVPSLQGVRA